MSQAWLSHLLRLDSLLKTQGLDSVLNILDIELEGFQSDPPQQRIVALLREAIQLDASFLRAHPQTLFQCLWNRCWWFDAPGVETWFKFKPQPLAIAQELHTLMEAWRTTEPPRRWLRSLRPPAQSLGSGLVAQHPYKSPPRPQDSILCLADKAIKHGRAPRLTSPAGTCQVKSGNQGSLLIDTNSGETLFELPFEDEDDIGHPTHHQFSANGRWLLINGWWDEYEGLVRVWEFELDAQGQWTGTRPRRVASWQDYQTYNDACFSIDASILTLITDNTVIFIDTDTWKERKRWRHRTDCAVPMSNTLEQVACVEEGWLRVWDLKSNEQPNPKPYPQGTVGHPVFSPKGSRVLTVPWLWNGHTGALIAKLDISSGGWLEGGPPANCLFVSDRRIIEASAGSLTVWDARTGQTEPSLRERVADGHFFKHGDILAYSPHDGAQMAFVPRSAHHVNLADMTPNGAQNLTVELPSPTGRLCYAPDGTRLAIGLIDGGIMMIDTASGEIIWSAQGHTDAEFVSSWGGKSKVTTLLFDTDGKRLVSSGGNEKLRIWEANKGECLGERGLDPFTQTTTYSTRTKGKTITHEMRYWDPSHDAIASLDGWCGFKAPSHTDSRWRLTFEDGATCVRDATTDEAVAWYPGQLEGLCEHPNGGIWASTGAHLILEHETD